MKKRLLSIRSMAVSAIIALVLIVSGQTGAFAASICITEWMYKGDGGEFIEFTNIGDTAIDLSGWSYDDEGQTVGAFDLSGLGIINPGESVIITEDTAADFRSDWGLDDSVKVLGGVTNNIGSSDEINLFDASGQLIDQLTYSSNTIRTKEVSANPTSDAALGINDQTQWVLSYEGDSFGSYASANGDVGNPGSYPAVPVPGTLALLATGLMALAGLRRKNS
jgi:predicted extracellular nuclease